MKPNNFFIQTIVLCIVFYQVTATFNFNSCGCNDEGVDVCNGGSCKKGITAPRPYPIQAPQPTHSIIKTICKEHSINLPKPFNPIGDICQCDQQVIKPAPLPNIRALCTHQLPKIEILKPTCTCNSCLNLKTPSNPTNTHSGSSSTKSCNCGEAVKAHFDDSTIYLETPKKNVATYPKKQRYGGADIVSVSIAHRLANSAKNSDSERHLQYGSLKEPVIPERKANNYKKVTNVNEESFYRTNGDVLEIKSSLFHRKPQVSTEEVSEESEEVKHKKIIANSPFKPAQLRYDDIGYAAYEQTNKPRYVIHKNSQKPSSDCNSKKTSHHHHNHNRGRYEMVADESSISEQSASYENESSSGQNMHYKSYST
ncbi:hypothetical protein PVAND_011849 [Polypedilum vanderplanki]|uniref:Uncharacterized protein n=1 Tax=Polypedilum vanderplanki TaxID=319348 RepID=A0A9J6CLH4_POLVA|nr:hypothetical protein PVAND_011849 [Polypedilum vanderplanki]